MKVQVKARQNFAHGNVIGTSGETYEFNKVEAQELADRGIVDLVQDDSDKASEEKVAAPVENKMEAEPENKAKQSAKSKRAD
jgi:hypothetical protein